MNLHRIGTDNQPSSIEISALGGFSASINTATDEGVLRWLGEMNVIGKFGFVYGEGVLGIDDEGIVLELKDLPKGRYKIKTYHHAPHSNTDSMDPNRDKLKSIRIPSLPYATALNIELHDIAGKEEFSNVKVSEGKELQFDHPGTMEIVFESNGTDPVKLIFKDADGSNGVWLNGFELMQQ